jgi:hypothetical protein
VNILAMILSTITGQGNISNAEQFIEDHCVGAVRLVPLAVGSARPEGATARSG